MSALGRCCRKSRRKQAVELEHAAIESGRLPDKGREVRIAPRLLPSATGEVGDAALRHGLDAFLEVVGQAQAGLLGKLVLGHDPDALSETGPQGRARRDQAE